MARREREGNIHGKGLRGDEERTQDRSNGGSWAEDGAYIKPEVPQRCR